MAERTAASLACRLGGIGVADPPTSGDLSEPTPDPPLPTPRGAPPLLSRTGSEIEFVSVGGARLCAAGAGAECGTVANSGRASAESIGVCVAVDVVGGDEGGSGSDSLIAMNESIIPTRIRLTPS